MVFDTQSRNTSGADENSSKDMNEVIVACDTLRAILPNLTVVLVHHPRQPSSNSEPPRPQSKLVADPTGYQRPARGTSVRRRGHLISRGYQCYTQVQYLQPRKALPRQTSGIPFTIFFLSP